MVTYDDDDDDDDDDVLNKAPLLTETIQTQYSLTSDIKHVGSRHGCHFPLLNSPTH